MLLWLHGLMQKNRCWKDGGINLVERNTDTKAKWGGEIVVSVMLVNNDRQDPATGKLL